MSDIVNDWLEYERGKTYNRRIDYYTNTDKNERFYAGDQWNGVQSNGLPTPVFNIFRRAIAYFIAAILSQRITMQYTPDEVSDNADDRTVQQAAETLTEYTKTLWENLKMDSQMRQALLDAALSADAAAYNLWDPSIDTGQPAQGDIQIELPDGGNVFFGNPNDRRVQKQPYIIISFRDLVSNLQAEAKANGMSDVDVKRITPDTDNLEQSGDRGKIELDNLQDTGKATAIIKLWKKDGTVWFNKSVKAVYIRKDVNTGLERYPLAWMNWDTRKNSYHGQAVGTGLVPNQIFINKMFAMVMVNLMHTAFPTVVYNSTAIGQWTNQVGQAIPVENAQDVAQVAKYLQPGEMSSQVMNVIDAAIRYTKDMIGASDAALGEVTPENTSAIIAVSQQAAIPLENIKANLYQWVEDIGYIWLDMMATYYGKRNIAIELDGQRQVIPFDFSLLKKMRLKLKVDVGPSSYWSEITAMQTLDNLLKAEKINFVQYLERVPAGLIPKKQELIDEIKQMEQMKASQPPAQQDIPKVAVNFKDLPPIGKIQAAAMAGIQLQPQDFPPEPIPQPTTTTQQGGNEFG